jgi:hypothetical protein
MELKNINWENVNLVGFWNSDIKEYKIKAVYYYDKCLTVVMPNSNCVNFEIKLSGGETIAWKIDAIGNTAGEVIIKSIEKTNENALIKVVNFMDLQMAFKQFLLELD